MFQDTASALFGVEGLRVTDVQAGPGGVLEVWAVTDYPAAAACPGCGTVSSRVHELVLARATLATLDLHVTRTGPRRRGAGRDARAGLTHLAAR